MFSVASQRPAGFLPCPVLRFGLFFPGNHLVCWRERFTHNHSRLQMLVRDVVATSFTKLTNEVNLVPAFCRLVGLSWPRGGSRFLDQAGELLNSCCHQKQLLWLSPAHCLLVGKIQLTRWLRSWLCPARSRRWREGTPSLHLPVTQQQCNLAASSAGLQTSGLHGDGIAQH